MSKKLTQNAFAISGAAIASVKYAHLGLRKKNARLIVSLAKS
jgi:hypothetical protein